MRWARSIACASTAGFHHGIEQEDVVGRRQVQAQAAGLEADQEQLAVRVVLEALDPRLRGRAVWPSRYS